MSRDSGVLGRMMASIAASARSCGMLYHEKYLEVVIAVCEIAWPPRGAASLCLHVSDTKISSQQSAQKVKFTPDAGSIQSNRLRLGEMCS